MQGYLLVIGSSAAVYVFIIIAIRLFGKKELAQLSVIDFVFILLISNAVQNAMVGADTTLVGGLVAAGTLFIMNALLKLLVNRFPQLNKLVQGEAIMLVYDGRLISNNLRKAHISMDELLEAAREHGVDKVEDINLAVLEMDGNISILSDDYQNRTKRKKRHYKQTV
jgi:uncharacterized membrane protein YcaP (DUF421 family)